MARAKISERNTEMLWRELFYKKKLRIPGVGVILAYGDDVPAPASAGYARGCLFLHIDGEIATSLYMNIGSLESCSFHAVSFI